MKIAGFISFCLLVPFLILAQSKNTIAYIEQYKSIAIQEMKRTGIPASITLAQAIVESSSGESNLAKTYNNHFGIKCKLDWRGETTYQDDDAKKECFRVYPNAASSFKDHSDFLKNRPNYAPLFELDPVDDSAWAYGLKKAGYATASDYPKKILKVIDDYELSQYNFPELAAEDTLIAKETVSQKTAAILTPKADTSILIKADTLVTATAKVDSTLSSNSKRIIIDTTAQNITLSAVQGINASSTISTSPIGNLKNIGTLPKDTAITSIGVLAKITKADTLIKKPIYNYPQGRIRVNNVPAVWANANSSFMEIATSYKVPLYKLYVFNELAETELVQEDQLIFLAPKKKENDKKVHKIKSGETLYSISQAEGIWLTALQEYNPSSTDKNLKEGEFLYLFKSINPKK
jgi:LysM repeat protein